MSEQRITITRDTFGRPDAIQFGSGMKTGFLFLDTDGIDQDGPLLGAIVYALNQLSEVQIESLVALAASQRRREPEHA